MNAKKIGLASLAVLLTLGGLVAGAQSNCIPTTGGSVCAISGSSQFIQAYNISQQNAIVSSAFLSNFGTFVAANLTNFLILGIILVVAFAIWDRFYKK